MNGLPQYKHIILELKAKTAYIYLNKEESGNTICGKTVEELYDAFQFLAPKDDIRCVVLSNKGGDFCSGPDLTWLKNSLLLSRKESIEESLIIGKLMFMIYVFSKPVVCVVKGKASSCGIGLTSVCDIVIAEENSTFVFDEVKYGFTPSLYAPYVIKKAGESISRKLFITGLPFNSAEAKLMGLVDYIVPEAKLEEKTDEIIGELLSGSPKAIAMIKDILSHVRIMRYDEVLKYTSECVAEARENDELTEGVAAKLEKRSPKWMA